jgi:hypothetical protein
MAWPLFSSPRDSSGRKRSWLDLMNSESPEFIGRAVAALAADADVLRYSGKVLVAAGIAKELLDPSHLLMSDKLAVFEKVRNIDVLGYDTNPTNYEAIGPNPAFVVI